MADRDAPSVLSAPLIEREDELAALATWADEADAGTGRLVIVTGEAGVGKSSLVEAFRSSRPELRWLHGACDSLFTPRPLGPLHDMGTNASAVAARGDREATFSTFLDDITKDTCVVVFEDLHWADAATLDLLRFTGRRIAASRTLIIATLRDDESPSGALTGAMRDLTHLPCSRRIVLSALSPAGVATLSGAREVDADEVHRLTGGNPFFVREVLDNPGTHIPTSIADSIRGRLIDLPASTRAAVDTAALMGIRINAELLEVVVPFTLDSERELLQRGILTADSEGLRFRHEITRMVLAEEIPPRQRTTIHCDILAALIASGSDNYSQMAFHAEGAGDASATLRYSQRAAESATIAGSMREAAELYQRAWDLSVDEPPALRATLADGLAEARGLLDQRELSLMARQSAISLWGELGEVKRKASSLVRGAWIRLTMGQLNEAFGDGEEAIAILEPLGDTNELAIAHAALARLHGINDDSPQALGHVAAGMSIARALELDEVAAELLNIEGCCRGMLGEAWEEPLEEAAELAQRVGNQPLVARVFFNIHCFHVLEAQFDSAQPIFDRALQHATQHDLDTYVVGLQQTQATCLLQSGAWDDAVLLAQETIEANLGDAAHAVEATLVIALAELRRGGSISGETLEDALREAEQSGSVQHLVPVRLARAEAAWLSGDVEAARKEVRWGHDLDVTQIHLRRDLAVWAHRLGMDVDATGIRGPAAVELSGQPSRAADAWLKQQCPYDAALALLGSTAESDLVRGVTILDELGATGTARLARKLMRDGGFTKVPSEPRSSTRAHPRGLTLREQEVLDLVAQGLRNRDIADRLFLSPKTVAVHVSSIIRKLGVFNRGEAAAWSQAHHSDI